jgi:integrase
MHRIDELRQTKTYGIARQVTFKEAAGRYLMENEHKRAIRRDADALSMIVPYIGDLPISKVHSGTIQPFVDVRLRAGKSPGTVNRDLSPVRTILKRASDTWRDNETGQPWLLTAPPRIPMLRYDKRKPYPLSWDEERRLFKELPEHLAVMALFKVNTGGREKEVVQLAWAWQINGQHAFLVPASVSKNGEDRIIYCNSTAWSVVDVQRGKHPDRVFTRDGKPVTKIYNTAWKRARDRAGLPHFRVHDLRHTFGHRIRALGIEEMDRKDLMGHKNGDVSRLYCAPSIEHLCAQAEKLVTVGSDPVLKVVGESS